MSRVITPLGRHALDEAVALLVGALPHDRIDVVCEEKLFGDDGTREGHVVGVRVDGELAGVLAQAGRFVKLLAVSPDHRRRGIGSALLHDAVAAAPGLVLRVGDHPGNYLSPGVDERYTEGLAFLSARGFVEQRRVENLRTPYEGNELVSVARGDLLLRDAGTRGYRIARPTEKEIAPVLAFIGAEFAQVWAKEAGLAYAGPRQALFCAFLPDGAPVAFAAADGNNQGLGWFGPAGTLLPHRGKKLGEALLLQCLLAVAGLPEAGAIAWIGPKAFYARAVGAMEDRRFVQLERPA